jgi:hypothetical protein
MRKQPLYFLVDTSAPDGAVGALAERILAYVVAELRKDPVAMFGIRQGLR